MSDTNYIKIQTLVESQIPDFLNEESPLFAEFLEQYYLSQEYETGLIDLAVNLNDYKKIDKFNSETFYSELNACTLSEEIFYFSDVIKVNDTKGFPEKYGLIKINDEIITYTGITTNTFTGCVRGFSGIESSDENESLVFRSTGAENHEINSIVKNLSLDFFNIFFKKFKEQFLPGFEDRKFSSNIEIKNILFKARDFYTSKGTDVAFKILFDILYSEKVEVIKPQDYVLSPSSSEYIITKNILVEQIIRDSQTKIVDVYTLQNLRGKTIFQEVSGFTASASIFNAEYRPVDKLNLYEISLDSESFILNFSPTKKTKLIEDVSANSTELIVDSTIGFKNSGELLLKTDNLEFPLKLTYQDKTVNQFLGVSGLFDSASYNADVVEENLIYIFDDDGSKLEFRLINVIQSVDTENTSNLRVGDKISLSSFGEDLSDKLEFNTWIYNIPVIHNIKSIEADGFNISIYLYNQSIRFLSGDSLLLINSNDPSQTQIVNVIGTIETLNGVFIKVDGVADFERYDSLKKIISKAKSKNNYFLNADKIISGVQNTYIDYEKDNIYVSSNGLPNYQFSATENRNFVFTEERNSDYLISENHNFITGEKIFYFSSYSKEEQNTRVLTGSYFVYKENSNAIKLCLSQNDLILKKYIIIEEIIQEKSDFIVKFGYEESIGEEKFVKQLKNQKLFKKINLNKAKITSFNKTTNDRIVGMLLNGVEINSPTLYDENVYYGKVDSIIIDNPGKNYDVINFSGIDVIDSSGSGCKATAKIVGDVKEIKIISPGVGYQNKPKLTIQGGNGKGASLEANLVKTNIISNFKGDLTALNFNEESITFLNNHNFDNGEEIVYNSNSNPSISPLVNNTNYFARKITNTKITLHSTENDAKSGINTVILAGISTGVHSFKTSNLKNTITKVFVKNSGEGYSNAKITVPSKISVDNKTNGINVYDNYIFAKNHGFNTGDIVEYSTNQYPISGLSTTSQYCVYVVDSNKFKLSDVGSNDDPITINLDRKKYVDITGIGTGTHTFKYPPITINIESLSSIDDIEASVPILEPIVLGSIQNIFIDEAGSNYGDPDIINFHRKPLVKVKNITSESLLKPIIYNDSIIAVQILNKGSGYFSDIDLYVVGKGKYAELSPVLVDGKIDQVKIVNGGIGYDEKTSIIIQKRGSDAKFVGNVSEWKINQVVKNKTLFSPDEEGIIIPSKDINLGLKYVNFFPPKKLRYLLSDNIENTSEEVDPNATNKRPYVILGWAYDGNPIFGPYARFNSEIRPVKSSYRKLTDEESTPLVVNKLRPNFEVGFFIQDYIFDKKDSSGDLDEYNGMFINDSLVPGISYGYFTTIDIDSNSNSKISVPSYPYIIGKEFKDYPNYEIFEPSFNQDILFNNLNLIRNIGPYYINSFGSKYDSINALSDQTFIVKNIKSSKIDGVRIYEPGDNYKVGDKLILDKTSTDGNESSIEVSRILGRNITDFNIGVSTFKNTSFATSGNSILGITSTPHNFVNNQEILISAVSEKKDNFIEGKRKIRVKEKTSQLTSDVPPQSITGPFTSINVNDVFGFNVDDFVQLGVEDLKIVGVSEKESKLYVRRSSGYAQTHYSGISSVKLLPNKFLIEDNIKIEYKENKVSYFNPSTDVGVGTTGSTYYKNVVVSRQNATFNGSSRNYIGVGTAGISSGDLIYGDNISTGTVVVSVGIGSVQINPQSSWNTGITTNIVSFERKIYDKFIPSKSIYIENHSYYTGQELIYNYGDGTGLYYIFNNNTIQLTDNQKVYAVNLGQNYIGLSTIGFTSTSGIGTQLNSVIITTPNTSIGNIHSFKTVYPELKGNVESYYCDIKTEKNHNLNTFDKIKLSVIPEITKSIKIRYDSNLRKITTDKISFNASLIDVQSNQIPISNDTLKTGDKVVYYSNSNTPIENFEDNRTYYILRENSDSIKLCDTYYDSSVGISKTFSSVGVGTHQIAMISPLINLSKNNSLNIILDDTLYKSDNTLNFDFKLFYDSDFKYEVESFKYKTSDEDIIIDTSQYDFGSEIYYNLTPIDKEIDESFTILEKDEEINGSNKIKIQKNSLDDYFSIVSTGSTTFRFNLKSKPESVEYTKDYGLQSIKYDTDSKNCVGPLSKFKINYSGLNYKKLPKVKEILSDNGTNSIVRVESSKIGKIESLERVKDGFDYPTDYTLLPLFSVPSVINVKDIFRIESVKIISGGSGYKSPPLLKVIGNEDIVLSSSLDGGSIGKVDIIQNVSNLSSPLKIVPIKNSNGIDIEFIEVNGTSITLELINSDVISYPFITTGVGSTIYEFPFKIGDQIFVENCRFLDSKQDTDSFNSKDYNYAFFIITSVDEDNFTITYDMNEIKSDFEGNTLEGLANYSTDFGYGYVVNKNNMPEFEMKLTDDLSYFSGESVVSTRFNGIVMDNGWDNDINQLRVIDSKGTLDKGEKIKGNTSLLSGVVESITTYNLKSKLGTNREKVNDTIKNIGILNDFQQKIADNDYYQRFSYSLKSSVPYSIWREPVLSLSHPSGFKQFSNLDIISKSSSNLKVGIASSDLKLIINIDNYASMYERNNFSMVSENPDSYFDNSIERITIGADTGNVSGVGNTGPISGVPLKPYILNKTNKVLKIDDIDSQFNGSNAFKSLGNKQIEIKSLNPFNIGISTTNIEVGDYVGLTTYLQPNTIITGISTNSITINKPHKLYPYYAPISTVEINTTVDNSGAYPYDTTFDSLAFAFDLSSFTFDSN